MLELPQSLQSRFYLYLTVGPATESFLKWLSLFGGFTCLVVAITRAILAFSTRQSHKVSRNRKYSIINRSNVYMSTIEEKKSESERSAHIRASDNLSEVEMSDECHYILEQEPALSDDEGDNDDVIQDNYESDYSELKVTLILSNSFVITN